MFPAPPSPSGTGVHSSALILLVVFGVGGCGTAEWTPVVAPPDQAPAAGSLDHPLKVHLHSGGLLMLDEWEMEEAGAVLTGSGTRYDLAREAIGDGTVRLPVDSVAVFESSIPSDRITAGYGGGTLAIAILGTISGVVTAACLADPKACFGSCPTFYVDGPDGEELVAEGFSASFARVLEERDVDALPSVQPTTGRFEVTMRNEAMETHAVRSVHLLAAPRTSEGGVVRSSDGRFHSARAWLPPTRCTATEGDCLEQVRVRDRSERQSLGNRLDLATRETIELEFPPVEGPAAVVITARHTLLSTFLFYQNLAYLGNGMGDAIAALERGDPDLREAVTAPIRELGALDVRVQDEDGHWTLAGAYREAGPLASDRQAIVLPEVRRDGPVRVQLDLVQGYWRIDEVAVVGLGEAVEPLVLPPVQVDLHGESRPDVLARLVDPEIHLHTYPGDEVLLAFDLPDGASDTFDFFLESEGYYYEWMRPEWLEDEDPAMAALALSRPDEMFRLLAPEFKAREAGMEELFWQSRFRGGRP